MCLSGSSYLRESVGGCARVAGSGAGASPADPSRGQGLTHGSIPQPRDQALGGNRESEAPPAEPPRAP